MTRSLLPLMLKDGGKTIINISSIGALFTRSGFSSYQTGKLAIVRFSEFINTEYGSQGILSFAIHPGGIMTELGSVLPKEIHNRKLPYQLVPLAWFCLLEGNAEADATSVHDCVMMLILPLVLTDTPEVAGDTIVYLTQERQEWLAGRYVSCTWDMPELFQKKDEIVKKDLLKIRMAVT